MMEIAESASQQEIGRNKVPAKFEQGGFTSGRREGPQTLFPGTSPGNQYRQVLPIKTRSAQRLLLYTQDPAASTTRNFFWLICKNCNAPAASFGLDGGDGSAEPGLRYLPQ
jgi:hypothetical protein